MEHQTTEQLLKVREKKAGEELEEHALQTTSDLIKTEAFENEYKIWRDGKSFLGKARERLVRQCSGRSLRAGVLKNFPFLVALQNYRVKRDLPSDVIAGVTSGIMMIPQGMAFALLASLPPITGLYVSLFASVTYFLLGTSPHMSWGPVAILSLMIGSVLEAYESTASPRRDIGATAFSPNAERNESDRMIFSLPFDTSSQEVPRENFEDGSWGKHSAAPGEGTVTYSLSPLASVASLVNATAPGSTMAASVEGLEVEEKIAVACSVTLVGGLALAVLAKLGLGRVATFFSNSLITGFTVGASVHVCTSQVRTLLGLRVPGYSGSFKVVRTWMAVLSSIHRSNPATVILSVSSIAVVYLVKKFVNERYKKQLKVPLPVDLVVVVVATVVSYLAGLHVTYQVSVVKDVPTGVPRPRFPDVTYGLRFFADAVAIMVVGYAQSVAMAKILGLKHNYRVDADQEMFAWGLANVVSSLFSGFVASASMSRSLVQEGAGGRTQVASLVAAVLVFMVIMFLGPYLYHLPACVLSAIIVVSLRAMLLKVLTIPDIWRKSQLDAAVWCITFTAVVILDVDIGLLVGVAVSMTSVLIRSQLHVIDVVEEIRVGKWRVWRPEGDYRKQECQPGVKVAKVNGPLYFANADIVTSGLLDIARARSIKVNATPGSDILSDDKSVDPGGEKLCAAFSSQSSDGDAALNSQRVSVSDKEITGCQVSFQTDNDLQKSNTCVTDFILDMSAVTFIDLMGVESLSLIIAELDIIGISVYLTGVPARCLKQLKSAGFLSRHQDKIFITLDTILDVLSQKC